MASNARMNGQQPTFEETIERYWEAMTQTHNKKVAKFEEKEAKEKVAMGKVVKDKATKGKGKYTWKQFLANKKRKLAWEKKENSSDDEFFYYDNLHFSFDP